MLTHDTLINFRTMGDWTADDLLTLVSAVNGLYNALLSYTPKVTLVQLQSEEFTGEVEIRQRVYWKPDWSPSKLVGIPKWDPEHEPAFLHYFSPFDDSLAFAVEPSASLRIFRISMASPGNITFSGLGDPIRELRELIKDIWYRNRHEALMREIEVIAEMVRLYAEAPEAESKLRSLISNDPRLAKSVAKQLRQIHHFQRIDKLEEVDENLAYTP